MTDKLDQADHKSIAKVFDLATAITKQENLPEELLATGRDAANLLVELGLDNNSIAASIIGPIIYYRQLPIDLLSKKLEPVTIKLIKGSQQLATIGKYHHEPQKTSTQFSIDTLNNLRKMLLAMVDDIRIVVIRLAEQVGMLKNFTQPDKLLSIAKEAMEIYSPLANRLGIAKIKWELEDLAFKYLNPEKYQEISQDLKQNFPDRAPYTKKIIELLEQTLAKESLTKIKITGRIKNTYSIYRKMERKNTSFENIYDISAIRIFADTIADCYNILSIVHSHWKHLPEEFDDYIASPKPNGYQSIHTAIIGPENRIVEIQIRTYEIHHHAELGVAAHWVYKEGKQEARYQAKLSWLKEVIDWQQEVTSSQDSAVDLRQIFGDYIYVFTPQGDILELPQGATPLDFAYHIHANLGHRCIGAKVNGKIVPLNHPLKTEDQIAILTSKTLKPSLDWLSLEQRFVVTAKARAKIAQWFKKENQQLYLEQGRKILEKELHRLGLDKSPVRPELELIAKQHQFKTVSALLIALGNGELKSAALSRFFEPTSENQVPSILNLSKTTNPKVIPPDNSEIQIYDLSNLLVRTANCCKPIPGEKIIGYVTKNRGITIHQISCRSINQQPKTGQTRLVSATWNASATKNYPVDLTIRSSESQLAKEIANLLSEEKIPLLRLQSTIKKASCTYLLSISINNTETLEVIIKKLAAIPQVDEVYRR